MGVALYGAGQHRQSSGGLIMGFWCETPIWQQMSSIADELSINDSNGVFQYLLAQELRLSRKLPMDMTARELIHAITAARKKYAAAMDEEQARALSRVNQQKESV